MKKKSAKKQPQDVAPNTTYDGTALYIVEHYAHLEQSTESPGEVFQDLLDVLTQDEAKLAADLAREVVAMLSLTNKICDANVAFKVLLHLIRAYDLRIVAK